MKRRYRVQKNQHFQEIRRNGQSYSNKLVVLCVLPNKLTHNRFGFSVSRRIGNAVTRNKVKRRLREIMRLRLESIKPGYDIVLIARQSIRNATYEELDIACARLLRRAHLLRRDVDSGVKQD